MACRDIKILQLHTQIIYPICFLNCEACASEFVEHIDEIFLMYGNVEALIPPTKYIMITKWMLCDEDKVYLFISFSLFFQVNIINAI